MSLSHYPGAWRIMMCDFNTGFKAPEIVKRRPVITISKRRRDNAQLCTVIPISSTRPSVIRDYHYQIPTNVLPHYLRNNYSESWVKADLIQTVAFFRLTMFWHGRGNQGQRIYQTGAIDIEHQIEISNKLKCIFALKILES